MKVLLIQSRLRYQTHAILIGFMYWTAFTNVSLVSANDEPYVIIQFAGRYITVWLNFVSVTGLETVIQNRLPDPKNDVAKICKPLADLVEFCRLVRDNKPKELKALLEKTSCDTKVQWREALKWNDVSSIFLVKHSSVISLILTSMMSCSPSEIHATRLTFFYGVYPTKRARDITEVLVTISETAELHDSVVKDIDDHTQINWSGNQGLTYLLECGDAGIKDDIENLCFELKDRKRAVTKEIDVHEVAKKLKKEKKHWDDKRDCLDENMIETPFEPLRKIIDEFKNVNDGVSLDDAFTKEFEDDVHKLATYRQLLSLARNKIVYFAEEIQSRIIDNDEYSLKIANAIAMTATLSKEDRDKLEAEYKTRNNNVGLFEELDKMSTTTGLEDVTGQTIKSFIADLKNKPK